jgi:hypothetical protein
MTWLLRSILISLLLVGSIPPLVADLSGEPPRDLTAAVPPANVSEDLSPYLGRIHTSLMMAAVEAYRYILLGNESEKTSYYNDIAAASKEITAFDTVIAEGRVNDSALVSAYREVKAGYLNMTAAADAMFTSFEKEGKPVSEDVATFETSAGRIFSISDAFWAEHNIAVGGPQNLDSSLRSLYGRLMGAVQNSYAYLATGQTTRKTDAIAAFNDYDAWMERFVKKFNASGYQQIREMKDEIHAAAGRAFNSSENEGTLNQSDLLVLKTVVDRMNDGYRKFTQLTAPAEKTG